MSHHLGDLVLAGVMLAIIGYAGAILIKRIWLEGRE